MPDIRSSLLFRKKMITLEKEYMRGIRSIQQGGKREMLDALSISGVKLSTIPTLKRVIAEMGTQSANKGDEISKQINEVTLWYLEKQREQIIGAKLPEPPSAPHIALLTGDKRNLIYEQTIAKEPQWVADMAQSIEINMTRLSVAGADLSTAIDRLLSPTIADGRASVLRLAEVGAEKAISTNTWVAGITVMNVLYQMVQQTTQTVYMKQAVAAIDERTTDCCLRVHGQVQPLDKPFKLDGSPRFSDEVDSPPFHWYCRTAQTLYTEKFEQKGITTEAMTDAARAELDAREQTGKRVPIHPADSTSRR